MLAHSDRYLELKTVPASYSLVAAGTGGGQSSECGVLQQMHPFLDLAFFAEMSDNVRTRLFGGKMAAPAVAMKQNLRSAKLDLRVKPADKQKIVEAAQLTDRKVTDFILEAALSQADQMLADRRVFRLDVTAWNALQKALDAPPRTLPSLKTLMEEPGFFDA